MFKALIQSDVRRFGQVLALCAAGLLAACGGGGGGGNNGAVDITLAQSAADARVAALTINTGESALLFWEAGGGTTSCVASGDWEGDKPTSSGDDGVSTGVITEAGIYTYTLTCSGSFGSISGSAVLTVAQAAITSLDCGLGTPTRALTATDGATVAIDNGAAILCVGCTVDNPNNIVNKTVPEDLTGSFATISKPLIVSGATTITVNGVPPAETGSYPAGPAGFLISAGSSDDPFPENGRQDLVVQTLLDGEVVESFSTPQTSFFNFTTQPNDINTLDGEPFTIQFLGLSYSTVPSDTVIFLGFNATEPYDAVRLGSGEALSGNSSTFVYAACVGAP